MNSSSLTGCPSEPRGQIASASNARTVRKVAKALAKGAAQIISVIVMVPLAALSGFGRFEIAFQLFSHTIALLPGLPGDYLRVAYYFMTLTKCPLHSRISFGSFFASSSVTIERTVYIGAYCVIANCHIGERTQIASQVQILGGSHQHVRDDAGRILPATAQTFPITIGEDCWIGASATVMANVGVGSTIGAGAVVTRAIPSHVVAAGIPARVIKELS